MIDIFIAYSHNDLHHKDELKKFLRPLLREGRVSMWDDFDIEAGQDWDEKIKERLYGADIVLLLVSADSLASDYFYSKEVKVSLERHARREATVVPVILRHCDWIETPLGNLEALPEKGRPVSEWSTRDQAMQDVVSRLRRVVESLEQRRLTEIAQAAEAHSLKEAEAQRQRPEKERLAQERREHSAANTPGDTSTTARLLTGIGAGVALVVLLLLWQPWKGSSEKPQHQEPPSVVQPEDNGKKNEFPEQPPADQTAFEQAERIGTVAAWKYFLEKHLNGTRRVDAEKQLADLNARITAMLKEANTYIRLDEPRRAKSLLQKVLYLDPDNATAQAKLKLLK